MKKTLFSCIALFTLGQAAMAQTLSSDSVLRPEAASSTTPRQVAPAQADANATPYWVEAQSYYDALGALGFDEGEYPSSG